MSTQFVKSPPTNPDSELWKIGTKWRKSQKTGIDYTELDNIMTKHADIDIETLLEGFNDQLTGRQKQSISYVGHLLVASYTQDGKVFVYGYPPDKSMEADKKASFNTGMVPEGAKQQQQQQHLQFKNPNPQQSNTAAPSTVQSKPTFNKQSIEVVYKRRLIAENDAMAIEQAEEDGLYIIPVKHTGVENWGFVDADGERKFYYGRIKLEEID